MTPATDRELRDAGAAEEVVVVEGQTYALSSKRGRKRVWCEDAYTAAPGLDGDPTQGIFSVFDGHGGRAAADFAAKHLHDAVLREVNAVSNSPQRQRAGKTAGQVARGLELVEDVKAAMIRGFLATDKRFLAECHLRGGATATTAFLRAGRIWVANVGDCRAVMCEDGQAAALTLDHRPDCAEERRAVERRGGKVVSILGTSRVQGVLGVSRALGDRDLKQFITAEPDVYSGPISDRSEFLILGTDGLWDVVGNQEATALVRACLGLSGGGGDAVPRDVEGGGRMEGSALAPRSSTTTSSVAAAAAVAAASPPKVECECVRDTSGLFGDVAEVATAAVGGSGRKGTDAACRGLVELARIRGSHDDISVLIVELRSYAQGTTPASMPGDQKVAETSPDATSLTSQSMSTPPETSLSS
jgi:protein phosphatase 1L